MLWWRAYIVYRSTTKHEEKRALMKIAIRLAAHSSWLYGLGSYLTCIQYLVASIQTSSRWSVLLFVFNFIELVLFFSQTASVGTFKTQVFNNTLRPIIQLSLYIDRSNAWSRCDIFQFIECFNVCVWLSHYQTCFLSLLNNAAGTISPKFTSNMNCPKRTQIHKRNKIWSTN